MNTSAACTVAILTPLGRGAVASVGVSGDAALVLVDNFFRSSVGRSLALSAPHQILFGRWERHCSGEEVVVCKKSATRCEVHCHGGRTAASAIVSDLVAAGAVELDWREWLRRDAETLIEAEALFALAEAPTQRCADVLLDQQHGALIRALEQIRQLAKSETADEVSMNVDKLLHGSHVGLHLTTPFRVALIGPTNVGKSTLINQLLGYQRAIVYEQPGTTRDVVSAITAFDGWPVELLDTAGIRETNDPLEAAGVDRSRALVSDVDLVIVVNDPSTANLALPLEVPPGKAVHHVLNKCDQLPASYQHPAVPGQSLTSALTGQGIADLVQRIPEYLVSSPPRSGEAVPFTNRQLNLLTTLRDRIIRRNWQRAHDALDEIIGQRESG